VSVDGCDGDEREGEETEDERVEDVYGRSDKDGKEKGVMRGMEVKELVVGSSGRR